MKDSVKKDQNIAAGNSDDKKRTENPHENHRSRLKARFVNEGLESFDAHLILELLLFYSIPRRDTNEIAHKLLRSFKSLSGVFDADIKELQECCGIGENSAILIKLIPQIARAYLLDKRTCYPSFGNLDKIGEYLVNYYIGCVREKVLLIMFNNNMDMIDCVTISEGTVNSANFPVRTVVDQCVRRNASCFIIAHNHPGGTPTPSPEDIELTKMLSDIFSKLNIPLIDHIIVAEGKYNTIINSLQNLFVNQNI